MIYPNTYCVFDTETTGLDTDTCQVLELAVKKVENGIAVETKEWLVRPHEFTEVSKQITEITGIDTAMIEKKGRIENAVWQEFKSFVGNSPLVGHNIYRYDIPVVNQRLRAMCAYTTDDMLDHHNAIDTAAIFKGQKIREKSFLPERLWEEAYAEYMMRVMDIKVYGLKFNLSHVCQELGIDVSDLKAHRAAADVEMTDRVYRKLCLKPYVQSPGAV